MSEEKWIWQCDRVIPSDTGVGRQVLEELLGQLEVQQWDRREIFGIHLAVDEAIVNAMVHGNCLDAAKRVCVRCRIYPEKVRVEVIDEGPGFDPDGVPDPTAPSRLGYPSGRGVMLMRAFMSRVEYHDRGNHVVLEKDRQR